MKNFDPYDFSKKEINGVPVYYKNLPWAPCIHIRIVFNTGAFDDPVGKEGLSHFLEHIVFDGGSPTLPDNKAIKGWARQNTLNSWNATTEFNQTYYRLRCLPEKYDIALSGMKDMIFNSYLSLESVEHERRVITQEAWGRFTNEKFLTYMKDLLDNLYHGHEHARFSSALGWPDTIAKISQEDIKTWHKNNYGIGNTSIVLVGAVEEKHIEALKDFLKDLPKTNFFVKNEGIISKPRQNRFVKTADEIGEIKEQVEVTFVRTGERIPRSEDEIANLSIKLIYDVLYESLRIDHSLCYGISISPLTGKTFSQISINVKTDEKNTELIEREFKNIINKIIEGKYIERFSVVKQMYLEQLRSIENLSDDIIQDALREILRYDGHIVSQKELIDGVEKVEYKDVVNFIKKIFDPEYIYTEIILPSKKEVK